MEYFSSLSLTPGLGRVCLAPPASIPIISTPFLLSRSPFQNFNYCTTLITLANTLEMACAPIYPTHQYPDFPHLKPTRVPELTPHWPANQHYPKLGPNLLKRSCPWHTVLGFPRGFFWKLMVSMIGHPNLINILLKLSPRAFRIWDFMVFRGYGCCIANRYLRVVSE